MESSIIPGGHVVFLHVLSVVACSFIVCCPSAALSSLAPSKIVEVLHCNEDRLEEGMKLEDIVKKVAAPIAWKPFPNVYDLCDSYICTCEHYKYVVESKKNLPCRCTLMMEKEDCDR